MKLLKIRIFVFFFFLVVSFFMSFPRHCLRPPEIYAVRSLCRSPPFFIQVILGDLARYLQWCEANCSWCGYHFLYDGLQLDTIPRWCAQCAEEPFQLHYDEEMELETFFVERGSDPWNHAVIDLGIVTSFCSDDFSSFTALRYE